MTGRTKVYGIAGHADILAGSAAGSDFYYNADGHWLSQAYSRIAGDPGHPGPDTHYSTAGMASSHDIFEGAAGANNVLHMGDGNEVLYLASGTVAAEPGPRLINITEIDGGTGNQIIDLTSPTLGYGSVKIIGGLGFDVLAGSGGNDSIFGGAGTNTLYGGSGNDQLYGGTGFDTLYGGDGNDKLYGGRGVLDGGAGNDTIVASAGADTIHGGDGNDVITAGAGAKLIYGGAGNDTLTVSAPVTGIVTIPIVGLVTYGGDGNDLMMGSGSGVSLYGDAGNDTLIAGPGGEILNGGTGNNLLKGGTGNDTLSSSGGNDTLLGGGGSDVLAAQFHTGTDIYGLSAVAGNLVTIYGMMRGQGDKLFTHLSELGLSAAPTTAATAGATADIGGGFATVTYASTANAHGSFGIASVRLSSDSVANVVSGPITATAGHAQFIYEDSTHRLWFDADGSGPGQAVEVALIMGVGTNNHQSDINSLQASDFILVNG